MGDIALFSLTVEGTTENVSQFIKPRNTIYNKYTFSKRLKISDLMAHLHVSPIYH
jgi:hypothetical protein